MGLMSASLSQRGVLAGTAAVAAATAVACLASEPAQAATTPKPVVR